jgi:hypothetical protein
MAIVILTLTDTNTGSVSIKSSFKPAVGLPITQSQAHALDMIRATNKRYGFAESDAQDGSDNSEVRYSSDLRQ